MLYLLQVTWEARSNDLPNLALRGSGVWQDNPNQRDLMDLVTTKADLTVTSERKASTVVVISQRSLGTMALTPASGVRELGDKVGIEEKTIK